MLINESGYTGMVSAMDAAIGSIVFTLRETGVYRDTLIVFVSDVRRDFSILTKILRRIRTVEHQYCRTAASCPRARITPLSEDRRPLSGRAAPGRQLLCTRHSSNSPEIPITGNNSDAL